MGGIADNRGIPQTVSAKITTAALSQKKEENNNRSDDSGLHDGTAITEVVHTINYIRTLLVGS